MFKIYLLLAYTVFHPVYSSQEDVNVRDKHLDETIDAYASVFHHQELGCHCKQNLCYCCEDEVGNVCISVGYYEVFDLPAAIGVNVTSQGVQIVQAVVNATDLPCIALPYIKHTFKLCLLLHGFNKTDDYVKVLFELQAKLAFTSFQVHLGCLMIPRLHPSQNSSSLVVYQNVLKQLKIEKKPDGHKGTHFCSENSSAARSYSKNIYVMIFLQLLWIKAFKS